MKSMLLDILPSNRAQHASCNNKSGTKTSSSRRGVQTCAIHRVSLAPNYEKYMSSVGDMWKHSTSPSRTTTLHNLAKSTPLKLRQRHERDTESAFPTSRAALMLAYPNAVLSQWSTAR